MHYAALMYPARPTLRPALRPAALALLLLLLGLSCSVLYGHDLWPEEEQRFNVGLKLFPAVLGGSRGLADKVRADGRLRIIVAHIDSPQTARRAARYLSDIKQINAIPLDVVTLSTAEMRGAEIDQVGGIFVSTPGVPANALMAWSKDRETLVFSPFQGDVEDGAVAGISVTDRILPYVNLKQARRAGIVFKPFFLRVAKTHD